MEPHKLNKYDQIWVQEFLLEPRTKGSASYRKEYICMEKDNELECCPPRQRPGASTFSLIYQ